MPARQTPRRHRRRPELRQFGLFDAARKIAPAEPESKALPEAARRRRGESQYVTPTRGSRARTKSLPTADELHPSAETLDLSDRALVVSFQTVSGFRSSASNSTGGL